MHAAGGETQRVTKAELARLRGCSKANITKYVKKGRLKFAEDGKIELAEAIRSLEKGKDPARELEKFRGPGQDEDGGAPDNSSFHDARTRREVINATLAEMNLKTQLGELVEAKAVRREVQNVFAELKDKLLALPTRVCGHLVSLPTEREIAAKLDEELTRILGEFTQTLHKGTDGHAH